jgi:hypothetical protein
MARIISNKHVRGVALEDHDFTRWRGVAGTYALVHLPTGRRYVGQSTGLSRRRRQHLYALAGGGHWCRPLQGLWRKSQRDEWAFVVLALCQEGGLDEAERNAFEVAGDDLVNANIQLHVSCPPHCLPVEEHVIYWRKRIRRRGRGGFGHPGEWVRAARLALGIRRSLFCALVAIDDGAYSYWCTGSRIDEVSWLAIKRIFDLPDDYEPFPDPLATHLPPPVNESPRTDAGRRLVLEATA